MLFDQIYHFPIQYHYNNTDELQGTYLRRGDCDYVLAKRKLRNAFRMDELVHPVK